MILSARPARTSLTLRRSSGGISGDGRGGQLQLTTTWTSLTLDSTRKTTKVHLCTNLCTMVTTCSVFVDLTFLFTVSVYFSRSPLTDFQPGNPTWPTPSGITQQQAHTKCLETLHGSQIWTHCQGSQDIVDTYLQNCVADTLVCSKGRQHKCFSPFPLQIQK